jgi:glycosyltransferase involved in cell wall biosynthesis
MTDLPETSRDFVFVLEHALGHVVHARNLEQSLAEEPDIAARIIPIKHNDMRMASRVPGIRNWSFEASWAARTALRKCLRDQPVEALFIHTQTTSLLSVGVMRTVPTIISMDATPINFDSIGEGYAHRRQPGALEWGKLTIHRRTFAAARAIVAHSQWAAHSVVSDYGIPAKKVHVIRPGVNLGKFYPGVERQAEATRILFVGGDFTRKGGNDLLHAMGGLGGSAELDIVTSDPPATIPSGVRARVHVGLGHDSAKLFDLYRRADIFALPSRAECYGHVIAEALASGLPVVACDTGAVSELVVDGENGLLIPPAAPAALEAALRTLVDRPDLRRVMAERALGRARREHDARRNAKRLFELMRQVAGGNPNGQLLDR